MHLNCLVVRRAWKKRILISFFLSLLSVFFSYRVKLPPAFPTAASAVATCALAPLSRGGFRYCLIESQRLCLSENGIAALVSSAFEEQLIIPTPAAGIAAVSR